MTEVYSILNQEWTNDFWQVPIIFGVFGGVIFLISLISLIKMIVTQNVFLRKIVINVLSMVFIAIWTAIVLFSISGDKKMYEDYCAALENGTCLVETGEPERIEIYRIYEDDDTAGHEISFYLNGKYFDSKYAYESGIFSDSDLRLIESSEIFEVKYIVDEYDDNIILSMSVGEKTD